MPIELDLSLQEHTHTRREITLTFTLKPTKFLNDFGLNKIAKKYMTNIKKSNVVRMIYDGPIKNRDRFMCFDGAICIRCSILSHKIFTHIQSTTLTHTQQTNKQTQIIQISGICDYINLVVCECVWFY